MCQIAVGLQTAHLAVRLTASICVKIAVVGALTPFAAYIYVRSLRALLDEFEELSTFYLHIQYDGTPE